MLLRHPVVSRAWAGRCYGRSDAGLGRAGERDAARLGRDLAAWGPDHVIHSGLSRTRAVARATGLASEARPDWAERDFGVWEGRAWDAIHAETGSAMDGMLTDPENFRPGGGETTAELARRAMAALRGLPPGRVTVITHGGPIAAILGTLERRPVADWPALVPSCGASVLLDRQ